MKMDFCPNCGSLLIPKTVESDSQELIILVCKKCGYSSKPPADDKLDLKTIRHNPHQMIAVIDKKEDSKIADNTIESCLTTNVWDKLNDNINSTVDSITLEDLVNEYKKLNINLLLMAYI
jgi:DNA-directed RNA polymerase subunit M/transcription elongation factor TFIIS